MDDARAGTTPDGTGTGPTTGPRTIRTAAPAGTSLMIHPPGGRARPSMVPLRVLAGLPLVWTLLIVVAPGNTVGALAGVTFALVLSSERAFRSAGLPVRRLLVVLGALLTPVHLWTAVRRDRRALVPALVWVAGTVLGVVAVATAGAASFASGPAIEREVEERLAAMGFPAAEVECPGTMAARPGATASCPVTGLGFEARVEVRFGEDRTFEWQVDQGQPAWPGLPRVGG